MSTNNNQDRLDNLKPAMKAIDDVIQWMGPKSDLTFDEPYQLLCEASALIDLEIERIQTNDDGEGIVERAENKSLDEMIESFDNEIKQYKQAIEKKDICLEQYQESLTGLANMLLNVSIDSLKEVQKLTMIDTNQEQRKCND